MRKRSRKAARQLHIFVKRFSREAAEALDQPLAHAKRAQAFREG
jgi:hypothetical protein